MDTMQEVLKTPTTQASPGRNGSRIKKFLPFIGTVVFVIAVIGGLFFLVKSKPEILGLQRGPVNTEEEVEDIVKKVGELMLLPNETPSLASVDDLSTVQDQEFFRFARVGDKVLIYREAKKAILYRPDENRIIEVGVVSEGTAPQVGGVADQATPTPTPTPIRETDIFLPDELTPTVAPTNSPTPTSTSSATPTP